MTQDNRNYDSVLLATSTPVASQEPGSLGVRVEECEFERLLERAMVILSARHLEAQLATRVS